MFKPWNINDGPEAWGQSLENAITGGKAFLFVNID